MSLAGLLLGLVLAQPGEPPSDVRFLSASITGARGEPLGGVMAEELAVVENGVARPVASVERDQRPLTLALLVDTSAAVQTAYRLQIVPAVLKMLARLPEGSRFTLWTTGDRPTRLTEPGSDRAAAAKALQRIAPQGGSLLLETIVDAAKHLRKQEGERLAMVAVSAFGPEFSSRDRRVVVEQALDSGIEVFSAVLIEEGGAGGDQDTRLDYEQTLNDLTDRSGGVFERLLASLAVESALDKIARDLSSRYRIGYATMPDLKQRKIELKIARPGARVRTGRPLGGKP